MVTALDFDSSMRRFDSFRPRHFLIKLCTFTRLAQRPERRLDKAWVDGSIPSSGTKFALVANANWHNYWPQKPGRCGFESRPRHQNKQRVSSAGRATSLQDEGRRFESFTRHHFFNADLAHLVERLPCKQRVICSSQIVSTTFCPRSYGS